MTQTKTAIVAAALGYSSPQVAQFLLSLRRTGYGGKVFFFTNEKSNIAIDLPRDLDFHMIRTNIPAEMHIGQIVSIRYFILQEFLRSTFDFEKILFTDVRDVIFQREPFDFLGWDRYKLFYALEERTIGDCSMNAKWLGTRYGQGVLRSMSGEVISCCGTVFAYRQQMAEYADKMCDHLRGAPAIYGMDTGAHNYILRKDPISGQKALLNGLSPIMTVHYMNHEKIQSTDDGRFANYDGSIPNLVHQYDRIPEAMVRKFSILTLD